MDHLHRPMSSSPPVYVDYSPPGSQDRSGREHLSDDHKFKRRRLDAESSPRSMTDPSRPPGVPTSMPASFTPHYLGFPTDTFHMPIHPGPFLEEDAALEYLASGTGFAQDLRGIIPPYPYNYSSFVSASPPPRPADLTSHPSHIPSRQDHGDPWLRASTADDFFGHIGVPDDRLRDVSARPMHPARHTTASHVNANIPTNFEMSRELQFPSMPVYDLSRRSFATTNATSKQVTMLVLSRATAESIEALEEHKRECPACQLEFEPDNFLAIITCCDTAMHTTCLSAWVNSQTYAKSKACMKCRRTIDARRMLNNVVPPVSDKNWDESAEFNAPESLKGDAKIELNISARPDRAAYRRMRGSGYYSGWRSRQVAEGAGDHIPAEARRALAQMREAQLQELDEMKRRVRLASNESSRAFEEDILANRALIEAQAASQRGGSIDLAPLLQRCEWTKMAKDKAREAYQKLQIESETMARSHHHRLGALVEEAWVDRYRVRVGELEGARNIALTAPNTREGVVNPNPQG